MSSPVFNVCVIGAGPAGLAAATTFSKRRWPVVVIDSHSSRLNTIQEIQNVPGCAEVASDAFLNTSRNALSSTSTNINFIDGFVEKITKMHLRSGKALFQVTFRKMGAQAHTRVDDTDKHGLGGLILGTKRVRFLGEENEGKEKQGVDKRIRDIETGVGQILARLVILATGNEDRVSGPPGMIQCWGTGIVPAPSFANLLSANPPSVGVLAVGLLADPVKCIAFARKFSTLAEYVNIYTNAGLPFLRRGMKRENVGTNPFGAIHFAHTFNFINRRIVRIEKLLIGPAVRIHFVSGEPVEETILGCLFKTNLRNEELLNSLEIERKESETGEKVVIDDSCETSHKGVYAVGDMTTSNKTVSAAAITGQLGAQAVLDKIVAQLFGVE